MVSIRPKNKRYHAFFEDEELGRYTTPEQAANNMQGSHLHAIL